MSINKLKELKEQMILLGKSFRKENALRGFDKEKGCLACVNLLTLAIEQETNRPPTGGQIRRKNV